MLKTFNKCNINHYKHFFHSHTYTHTNTHAHTHLITPRGQYHFYTALFVVATFVTLPSPITITLATNVTKLAKATLRVIKTWLVAVPKQIIPQYERTRNTSVYVLDISHGPRPPVTIYSRQGIFFFGFFFTKA